ncbi:uncharacterized protein BX664DRAFT_320361 [Halteromyces radiatus]|uniref:uncharacterized protein n=1 Tax=Halteromyces radiatus TaxID=101107 RepID=UPI00221E8DD3|nr:uncharacterized protein BX664DRAFT_320361 [Halteromyces radiatus]KAI8099089.1 hypothetical protein BX664DRAFT_320361 [Halteromyces radiatus]
MNRLPFGSFHASHFNPQQVQQWQLYLQRLQTNMHDPYVINNNLEEEEQQQQQEEDNYITTEQEQEPLSKEALAIFEFSEAYSKQKEQDNMKDDDLKNNQEKELILNEFHTLYSDGIEAPATSLVLLSSPIPNKDNDLSRIDIQRHLLNSSYVTACTLQEEQSSLVMWPVLPFRL